MPLPKDETTPPVTNMYRVIYTTYDHHRGRLGFAWKPISIGLNVTCGFGWQSTCGGICNPPRMGRQDSKRACEAQLVLPLFPPA